MSWNGIFVDVNKSCVDDFAVNLHHRKVIFRWLHCPYKFGPRNKLTTFIRVIPFTAVPLTVTPTDGRKRDIRGLVDSFLDVAGNKRWSPEKDTT